MCVADGCSIYLAHNIYFGRCSSHFAFCIYDWNATQSTNCIFLFWFFFLVECQNWIIHFMWFWVECRDRVLLVAVNFLSTHRETVFVGVVQSACRNATDAILFSRCNSAIVSCLIFNICSSSTNLNWAEKYSSFDRNRAFIFMIWHAKHAEAARGFK